MSMYNLLKYSNGYAKTSVKLWQFRRDEPDDDKLKNSESFKFKCNLTDNTNNAGIVNAEIGLLVKYLCNFCRLLEMLLIDCDLTLNLIWSANCVICEALQSNNICNKRCKYLCSSSNFFNLRKHRVDATIKIRF